MTISEWCKELEVLQPLKDDKEKYYGVPSTTLLKVAKEGRGLKNLNSKQTINQTSNITSINKSWK